MSIKVTQSTSEPFIPFVYVNRVFLANAKQIMEG